MQQQMMMPQQQQQMQSFQSNSFNPMFLDNDLEGSDSEEFVRLIIII
jgi:hypothetical protein